MSVSLGWIQIVLGDVTEENPHSVHTAGTYPPIVSIYWRDFMYGINMHPDFYAEHFLYELADEARRDTMTNLGRDPLKAWIAMGGRF